MFTEDQNVKYTKESHTVMFQGKPIIATDYTPILSPEERTKRKKEIERTLFDIFKKYSDTNKLSA